MKHIEQSYLPKRNVKSFLEGRQSFIKLLNLEGFTLLSEYIKNKASVNLKCPKGHLIELRPNDFKNGNRCAECSGVSKNAAERNFYYLLEKENYILLDKYTNSKEKVKMICPNGHPVEIDPNHFVSQGRRCRKCRGLCTDSAEKELYNIANSRGDFIIGQYVNGHTPIQIKYGNCGHVVDGTSPSSYKSGTRCSDCINENKESHLATFAKKYAREIFSEAHEEYKICRNPKTNKFLPFDLYIPEASCLIEIHGEQHYELRERGFYSDIEKFAYRKELDRYKKEWGVSNGYCFIEIDIREHDENTVAELLNNLK